MTSDRTQWLAISPLLDDLLEMGIAERDARLASLREDDPALAASVELLLAQGEAAKRDAFLDGCALPGGPGLAGHSIGSYMLDRPLARGGMGSVWLAHRSDGRFEGKVAIKFLNLALLGHGGAERFAREGQVLARLAHPNIARLLDAGVAADGHQPYLVLEYVDGVPIDRWCEAQRASVEARVRLFLDVVTAVEFAHRHLILHRDLKPANILVTGEGRIKLLDFGIAKLLDDGSEATELTQLAGAVFTPEYAAPEQIQRGPVTTATDVYALGVLLYRLLSGEHPTSTPDATPVEQLRAVLETEPLRVSLAASRATQRNARGGEHTTTPGPRALGGDLDTICAKALKKLPGERYPTAAALADDLQRYLDDRPVSARPDSRGYRIRKFLHRHRLGVGAVTTMLLALIAGVISTTWQAIEARRERDVAVYEAARASANRKLVGLVIGAMGDAERPLTPREILERSEALIEMQFLREPRIAVDMLLHIAGQYHSQGSTDSEYRVMQRAIAVAQASGNPGLIADAACNTVETELLRERADLARLQLDIGQRALARMERPDLATAVSCIQASADLALAQGDTQLAIAQAVDAIERVERAGKTDGDGYAKLLSFLGNAQRQGGHLIASHETGTKLRLLDERLQRTETVDYLRDRANESVVLAALGEYAASRKINDALALRWTRVTGDADVPASILNSRGVLAYAFGDLDAAERDLVKASAQFRSKGTIDRASRSDLALARVLIAAGRTNEADRLLTAIEAEHATRTTSTTTKLARAELLLAQRALPQAADAIEHELAAKGYPASKDSPLLAETLRIAARVSLASGNPARALSYANDAVAIAQRLARDPSRSAHVGEALLLVANAQRVLGEGAASSDTAKRAALSLANSLGEGHRATREANALAGQR